MTAFLIHRLRNAAIAADARGDRNLAELLTEAINELEKKDTARTEWQQLFPNGVLGDYSER